MHLKIFLVLALTISLVGISYLENANAATHNFESEWGKAGIKKSGFFLSPQHLAFDSKNNVFITDLGNSRIQKFDSNGNFLLEWGSKGNNPGEFGHPSGIVISEQFVFVVDNKNNNIQKFDLDGKFITKWGKFGKDVGFFNSPRGITVSDDKFVYVVDSGNARIQKFTSDGEFVYSFGQSGKRGGNFITPVDIAINSDKIYVTDPNQNKIIVFDLDGNFKASHNDSIGGYQIYPEGIVFDEQENFYVVDYKNNRIIHYNDMFVPLSIFGQLGPAEGEFKFPKDVAISNDGYLFVTDTQGHRIQKFSTPISDSNVILEDNETIQTEIASETESEKIVESQLSPIVPIPNDFVKPTILVPEDIIVEASGPLTLVNIGEAMATDQSGISSLSNNAPKLFPLGINTIIWTAVDGAGNMAIASQTVTIQDSTPPQISSLENIVLEAKSSNQNTISLEIPEVFDKVGLVSIENDAPEVFPLGETIVTWTATDVVGNISTLSHSILLIDSVSPRIAFSEDIIIEASSLDQNQIELIIPETSDDVEVASITNDAPEAFPLGETIVTWTATDTSGNSATDIQYVIVEDTTVPSIQSPSDIEIEISDNSGMKLDIGLAVSTDIVEVASITNDAPEAFPLGETIVTWTATDTSGNSATATQIINIVDTTAPVLNPPTSISQEAINLDYNLVQINIPESYDIVEVASITNDAPEAFPLGETIVTWTATDTSGNSATATQSITILDTTQPIVAAPEDIQSEATSMERNIVDYGFAEASDQVEVASITNDAPEAFPLGETIVTWTATDTSGNSATASHTVFVMDTTSPIIEEPEEVFFEAITHNNNEVKIPMIKSQDNTEIASITNDAPTLFEFGTTLVTWTVVDTSGNSSTVDQEIHVIDTTQPIVAAPEDIQSEATSMERNIVDYGFAEASDQVEVASITNDAPEAFPLGETIVTWTATDTSGNSATATQIINIVDTTSPVLDQPGDIIVDATSKSNNLIVLDPISASDSISDVIITNNAPLYYKFGETIVTWTATDTSGNSATATQIIRIVDTTAPILNIPENIMIDALNLETFLEIGFASAEDIIDNSPIISNDAPEVFPLGETIVTWTTTDQFGNSATATQTISVQVCGNSPSYYNLIIGTEDDDLLIGTTLPDLIFAYAGDDIISGGKGNDCIMGGNGNDIIYGNEGDDNISGENGNDIIKGHSGEDFVFGGLGLDMIDGGEDLDTCKIIDEQNFDLVIKCESNE